MICNSEMSRFSRKYGLRFASKYINSYLTDIPFHTDAIFGHLDLTGISQYQTPVLQLFH
jgi:hypothetical protein